jgi:TRAP-type uncharacterized transport system substrate-binding protein
MKKRNAVFAVVLLLVLAITTFSQSQSSQLRVAVESSSGTYKKMLGDIINVCSTDNFSIIPAAGLSGGAPDNLDALITNKADAAFLHSDVFFANSQADPSYNKLKTLVALYPEPIHVLALRNSKTKKAGAFTFGTVDFNSLSEMSGYKVGAAGGGVFTARILQGQGQGGFQVVTFDRGDDVVAALNNGDIAAAIFVGASPLPNIEKLPKSSYKLLPIGENIAGRVTGIYRPATINYNGITNGPLKTMAPVAVLLTRAFTTPAKIQAQQNFRSCFYEHLNDLKDSASPNWQAVEANDQGTLNNWLVLPESSARRK